MSDRPSHWVLYTGDSVANLAKFCDYYDITPEGIGILHIRRDNAERGTS